MGLATALILFAANLAVLCLIARRFSRRLAGHKTVPLHFNLKGLPDRYGPPGLAVWIMPALYALIGGTSLLASMIERLEPATATEVRQGIAAIGPIFIVIYLAIIALTLRAIRKAA